MQFLKFIGNLIHQLVAKLTRTCMLLQCAANLNTCRGTIFTKTYIASYIVPLLLAPLGKVKVHMYDRQIAYTGNSYLAISKKYFQKCLTIFESKTFQKFPAMRY